MYHRFWIRCNSSKPFSERTISISLVRLILNLSLKQSISRISERKQYNTYQSFSSTSSYNFNLIFKCRNFFCCSTTLCKSTKRAFTLLIWYMLMHSPPSLLPLFYIQTIWQFACANKLQGEVSSLSVQRTLYKDRVSNVISRVPCLFSICSDLIIPPTTCRCL